MGRANAPNRQNSTAMTQLAFVEATPPPAHGRHGPKRIKNLMSSPVLLKASLLEPVKPVRPAAGYIGGKRNLAKRLVPLIGSIPHECYAEVFVGMGGIFLRRDRRPKVEVINDWSDDVSTFFRILQRHYTAFMDMLRYQLTTRARFEQLRDTDPATLTDLERAARFLYLQRLAFGGKVAGRNFGVAPSNSARFDITKLAPLLEELHERLAPVVIERLPFSKFIASYDRLGTLFYLDPPYFGCERDYGDGMFCRDDFALMADQLRGIKGRFILSINDTPEIRETFSGFNFEEVPTTYQVGGMEKAKAVTELVISNR
jgi:DNA adenine methylase